DGLSLYSDTLPPVTGVPSATHASPIPASASRNWKKMSGRVGLPKLRQFVIAIGRAPTHATLRAASATAIRPPTRGSRYTYRPLQSVFIAIALSVPRTRSTAASPPPGPITVLVRTVESYCRYTHR